MEDTSSVDRLMRTDKTCLRSHIQVSVSPPIPIYRQFSNWSQNTPLGVIGVHKRTYTYSNLRPASSRSRKKIHWRRWPSWRWWRWLYRHGITTCRWCFFFGGSDINIWDLLNRSTKRATRYKVLFAPWLSGGSHIINLVLSTADGAGDIKRVVIIQQQ